MTDDSSLRIWRETPDGKTADAAAIDLLAKISNVVEFPKRPHENLFSYLGCKIELCNYWYNDVVTSYVKLCQKIHEKNHAGVIQALRDFFIAHSYAGFRELNAKNFDKKILQITKLVAEFMRG